MNSKCGRTQLQRNALVTRTQCADSRLRVVTARDNINKPLLLLDINSATELLNLDVTVT